MRADQYPVRKAAMERVQDPRQVDLEFFLRHLESNEFPEVREWAADQLGELRDPRAVEPLAKAMRNRENRARRAAAVVFEVQGPSVESARDRDIQTAIAQAFYKIGRPSLVALESLVHSEYPDIRESARWAWYQIGGEKLEEPTPAPTP